MRSHPDGLHVQAHHGRGLGVSAYRIEGAAEPGMAQKQKDCQQHKQGDYNRNTDIGRHIHSLLVGIAAEGNINLHVGELIESRIDLLRDGNLIRTDNGCHTSAEEHTRHGDNKGLNLQITDQKALEGSERDSDQQDDQHHGDGADSAAHSHSQHHTVHGDQGADGNVDAGRQHDDGQSAGHADQAGVRNQDIQKSLKMCEALAAVSDAAARVKNDEQGDRNQQKDRMSVQTASLSHTAPPSLAALARRLFFI